MDVKLLHQGSNGGTAVLYFTGWSAPTLLRWRWSYRRSGPYSL